MNTNVKIIDLKLGNKIDFKLVFLKQKVNLQTSISLCNFGKNNSVNLKLNLITNTFNCGTTLSDFTDIEYYIIDNKTSDNSSEYLKISAILADFGCNVPLNSVNVNDLHGDGKYDF